MSHADRPHRVQLSRKKGWRMPPNTVSVARPGKWGNPFKIGELKAFINNDDPADKVIVLPSTVAECVTAFRWMAMHSEVLPLVKDELRGKNLACWCALDAECHADVLLELAND